MCIRDSTNIVGKYGPHIQRRLKKAGGVLDQIKYICPLHGPGWRKDLGWFIEKYDTWSRDVYKRQDSVCADGRLLECASLKCAESALTGESMPVEKDTELLSGETALGDRKNICLLYTTRSV